MHGLRELMRIAALAVATVGLQAFPGAHAAGLVGPGSTDFRVTQCPMPQRTYVWQRVWTPAVCRDVSRHAASFSALDVLAAEIVFPSDTPNTVYTAPNWEILRRVGHPVGIVVRIGPCRSDWKPGSVEASVVLTAVARVLAEARSHGIEPSELQLDFDAATSRLPDYGTLLRSVRQTIGSARLTITVLPAWLDSASFRSLATAVDAYVLQVHSLEKPHSFSEEVLLCDPTRAEHWITEAAALGIPFRVALPCYGYRMAFDASGRFAGLQAEGPARSWPPGVRTRLLWASPARIGGIVRAVTTSRPQSCEALCWFRLPVEGDELCWRWPTLTVVMRGEIPNPKLVVDAIRGTTGAMDLEIRNDGTDCGESRGFRLSWNGARLIAADGVSGWTVVRDGDDAVRLMPPSTDDPVSLQPGDSIRIGWMRLDAPAPVATTPL